MKIKPEKTLLLIALFVFLTRVNQLAAQQKPLPTISSFTENMVNQDGFYPLYWDDASGKIYLEITALDKEILYYPSLAAGLGSNDIGLDRGRLGGSHVVSFNKSGNKILMTESNYDYRANTDNPMEQKAVEESFAKSVLWGFELSAQTNEHYLVDVTDFVLRDAIDAAQSISRNNQGNYKVDKSRSAVYLERTKAFPKNTEIEAIITLTGAQAGGYLRSVTPSPDAVTLRMHHSFVELPDDGYTPREFDPRAGVNQVSFYDFASPINESIVKRYIRRHRLEKVTPGPAPSEVKEPIIYYIDPGTPEPIRTALMEGTQWWAEAFESAGFINAFQVKLLPEDADPMDIRYNLVQWVHRSTRGWSYGGGITDPRTGEIIKGKVTLGSLRVRQDFLIAQGLIANYLETGEVKDEAMLDMALARMRQLAAHEVGHTLGLPHNYIASSQNRASVMDYPHPSVKLKGKKLDISDAYAEGIGEWDKVAIQMAYTEFPEGQNEKAAIQKMVEDYRKEGLDFLSDQDARPAGSAHPATHLWDNGKDAVEELNQVMKIRALVLADFDESKIKMGEPLATIEEVFVPMYLFHRYQVEAVSKVIAGVNYSYWLRGNKEKPVVTVPAKEQKEAIESIIATLSPENLKVPEKILELIPPRPYGYRANPQETFSGKTGLTFDPMAAPQVAADLSLSLLFNPQRASRLVNQHAMDNSLPGLEGLIEQLINYLDGLSGEVSYEGEIKRMTEKLLLQKLIQLSQDNAASAQARSIAYFEIEKLIQKMSASLTNSSQRAHYEYCEAIVAQMHKAPKEKVQVLDPLPAPAGSPIGNESLEWLRPICSEE
ncbi:zinc-dependent metalloprotease [Echinicola marina]|uniref:zinc-dependent metalloprotease n=1 Tax=Echinicola marina TaxID=2859768 RepID=UPI001CF67AC5|nr:zinc-dependent metalloprotease [Echinicola marina]UCS91846.1 zinc-dependent metalloprotease [Echinicola marina]